MKAQVESSCIVGGKAAATYVGGGVRGGKVQKKSKKSEGEEEVHVNGAEMKAYLNKLQEIVPFMPKNKRLSKVEVISYVIDYIHDLRETLGMPPCTAEDDQCMFEMEERSCSEHTSASSISKVCEDNGSSSLTKKQDHESRPFSGEE